ncbi:MAG TPA: hypothetical protein VFU10_12800, partial [Gaiellaceae bacterium]|nr:hypothetical protein [Gaiellaceae bacterium]
GRPGSRPSPSSSTRPRRSPARSLASRAERRAARNAPLPPPLPPARRTIGQVVAESLRFYGSRFWGLVPTGIAPAALDLVGGSAGRAISLAVLLTLGSLLMTAAYVRACVVLLDPPLVRERLARGFAVGVAAFVVIPLVLFAFVVPGVVWLALVGLLFPIPWLAFVGLAVPVALVEGAGFSASFRRAVELARAGYVHAVGSLFTLVVVFFLSRTVLVLLLQGQGDQTQQVAVFLADLVLAPVLFVGGALLYIDQNARWENRLENDSGRSRAEIALEALESRRPPVEEA